MPKDRKPASNKNTEKEKRRIFKSEPVKKRGSGNKFIIIVIIAAAFVCAVLVLSSDVFYFGDALSNSSEDEMVFEEVSVDELTHLCFDPISVNSSELMMSAEEFSDALRQLYERGYVLIDIYDIIDTAEDGSVKVKETVEIPKGKKPLILSESEACCFLDAKEEGTAEKLVIQDDTIKALYTDLSGSALIGDYDIVPMLETFIEANPDFSYEGARAVLGVSGYCGVFGYRTTSYFASESEDENPYVSYGVFDTGSEIASAKEVAQKLISLGYHFASYGFADDISYGAEYSIVKSDLESWLSEVEPIVGETDIILLPRQTDIDSWNGYSKDNKKYSLLSDAGFKIFFVGNNSTPYLIQSDGEYVRQTIYEIHNNADFTALFFNDHS